MESACLSRLKFVHHFSRYSACLGSGPLPPPITLEVDPTNCCDNCCVWCTDKHKLGTEELPWALLEHALHDAVQIGVCSVVFKGGGEPAQYCRLSEALRLSHGLGLAVGLVTNGQHLTTSQCEEIMHCCDWVRISLDAPDAETHCRVHGIPTIGRWDGVVGTLSRLITERGNRKLVVGATMTLGPANAAHIEDVYRLAVRLELDYLLVRPPFGYKPFYSAEVLQAAAYSLRRAKAVEQPGTLLMAPPADSLDRYYCGPPDCCRATPLVAVLGADGKLYACCATKGISAFAFASLHETTLASVWGGDRHRDLIAGLGGEQCAPHCTDRLSWHNEVLKYLARPDAPHVEFA